MSEWISVKDRLPCFEEKEYLVTDGECVDVYWWKYFLSLGKKGWQWNDRDEFFDFNVTHWMPLPDKPKKHWSQTEDGKKQLLNLINEEFFFLEDGTALRRDEYCSKCRNEWVACVCISEF